MRITPADFEFRPAHFLELDGLPQETFDEYVERHIELLSYAYTVAEGAANPTISVSDGHVERIYTPDDFNPEGGPETNQQFVDRVKEVSKEVNIHRMFFHAISPMLINGSQLTNGMFWYAKESGGEHRVGRMDTLDYEGHYRVLDLSRESQLPKGSVGWVVEALDEIL